MARLRMLTIPPEAITVAGVKPKKPTLSAVNLISPPVATSKLAPSANSTDSLFEFPDASIETNVPPLKMEEPEPVKDSP